MKDYSKLKEIASLLDGYNFRDEDFERILEENKYFCIENGIVICYGYSDDLLELDGAIHAEFDCWCNNRFYINENGKKTSSKYVYPISVICCENKIFWQYKFKPKHEIFTIYDDEDIFCKGIVFFVEDLKKPIKIKNKEWLALLSNHDLAVLILDVLPSYSRQSTSSQEFIEKWLDAPFNEVEMKCFCPYLDYFRSKN